MQIAYYPLNRSAYGQKVMIKVYKKHFLLQVVQMLRLHLNQPQSKEKFLRPVLRLHCLPAEVLPPSKANSNITMICCLLINNYDYYMIRFNHIAPRKLVFVFTNVNHNVLHVYTVLSLIEIIAHLVLHKYNSFISSLLVSCVITSTHSLLMRKTQHLCAITLH